MRNYVLDTGIAGLCLDGKRGVAERAAAETARGNRVGIAGPTLGEPAQRAEGSPFRARNLLELRKALDEWRVWLVDVEALFEFGGLAHELKLLGRPIGQNDMMIAAVARKLPHATLVTMDADFAAVPGLAIENWATNA